MNSSQPQGAPNTAYQGSEFSFNWLETVQHLSEKQANSPDPRTRSLNGQEFLKKKKRSKRDAAGIVNVCFWEVNALKGLFNLAFKLHGKCESC